MHRTLLALTLLWLPWMGTGCTSAPLVPSPFAEAEVAPAIRHDRDTDAGMEVWVGPPFTSGPVRALLRARRDAESGDTTLTLHARHTYRGDWLLYDGASAGTGEPLEFSRIRQEVVVCREIPCGYLEQFGVEIPLAELERAALMGGLRIHARHRAGHQEILVPAGYAMAFAAAVRAPVAAEATAGSLTRHEEAGRR